MGVTADKYEYGGMTFTYVNMRESATLGFNAVRLSELDKTLCEGSTIRSGQGLGRRDTVAYY